MIPRCNTEDRGPEKLHAGGNEKSSGEYFEEYGNWVLVVCTTFSVRDWNSCTLGMCWGCCFRHSRVDSLSVLARVAHASAVYRGSAAKRTVFETKV